MSPRVLKDSEVDEAVDSLLSSFGIADDGTPAEETGFDTDDARPTLDEGEKPGVAPSADVGALWGAAKPRKK
jgi:hypothetical protein